MATIEYDDTVRVAGVAGNWVVDGIRPARRVYQTAAGEPTNHLVDIPPQASVSRTVRVDHHTIRTSQMTVALDRLTLVRKGNRDADALAAYDALRAAETANRRVEFTHPHGIPVVGLYLRGNPDGSIVVRHGGYDYVVSDYRDLPSETVDVSL